MKWIFLWSRCSRRLTWRINWSQTSMGSTSVQVSHQSTASMIGQQLRSIKWVQDSVNQRLRNLAISKLKNQGWWVWTMEGNPLMMILSSIHNPTSMCLVQGEQASLWTQLTESLMYRGEKSPQPHLPSPSNLSPTLTISNIMGTLILLSKNLHPPAAHLSTKHSSR